MLKVQELRENAGLSQHELADKVGVAHSTIARIENGARKISTPQAKAIAEYFNVTVDYLLGDDMREVTSATPNNKLKELREAKGLSLRELGSKVGMDSTTLNQIENGKRNLTARTAQVLSDFFGVPIDQLFGRVELDTIGSKRSGRNKEINSIIGKNIKKFREDRGLTQAQLGEIVGRGDSTVRMWELGSSEPDSETLLKLSECFGVSVGCLLGKDDGTEKISVHKTRLKELRESKGLTLRELAEALGVDFSTLGHIENGRSNFSIESLQRACAYFGVTTDYMLCRDENFIEESTLPSEQKTVSTERYNCRLRELRKAKGVTAAELGKFMGVCDSAIKQIETGRRQFSLDSLKRACEFFGITPNEMLGVTVPQTIHATDKQEDAIRSKDNKYIRTIKQHGYVEVYYPESPMAKKDGWVLMHRLVMSLSLGRPLTEEEVVHHINGDPGDNRLSNLQLFPNNTEHLKWHAVQRRDEIIKSLLEQ